MSSECGEQALLAPIFLVGVSEPVRVSLEKEPDIELLLLDLVRSARAPWPPFSVTDHEFVAFVAQRFGQPDEPRSALLALRAEDLFLAFACSVSAAAAHTTFRKHFDNEIVRAVRRFGPRAACVDDIQQIVYEKLFVGGADAVPKITQYRGRGSLLSWIRVVVLRVMHNLHRGHRHQPTEESQSVLVFGRAVSRVPDPEMAYLKLRYGDAVRLAIRQALASLTTDERNILRYRYRDDLAVDVIARIYQVHRMTMTRRIASVRRKVLLQTHVALAASLGCSGSEVSSIMRLAPSQLGVTLSSAVPWEQQ